MDQDLAKLGPFSKILQENFPSNLEVLNEELFQFYLRSASAMIAFESAEFYDSRVTAYDENLHLTFETHGEEENKVRSDLIRNLNVEGKTVLELASGTGRDSAILSHEVGPDGGLIALDPAGGMLSVACKKLSGFGTPFICIEGSAEEIPLKTDSIDVVYSFGGFNEFADKSSALREIVRVAKPGARVLICDEGIPQWWRNTDFYQVLCHTNAQFAAEPPIDFLPVEARNTTLRWVNGETFWVIEFEIGEGEPTANFDIPIPGTKGGTLRTRYYGKVQGVSLDTRAKLNDFLKNSPMSEHEVVDAALVKFLGSKTRKEQLK